MSPVPQLLVSVRNADEAMAAASAGADIVDVKEPANGSLGRATNDAIASIAHGLQSMASPPPFSIALGELAEWRDVGMENESIRATLKAARPTYLKMGLAGTSTSRKNWRVKLDAIRQRFVGQHKWVAVAYADFERAVSPSPLDVCRHAIDTNAAVLLIDTFRKDGTNLRSWLSHEQLIQLRTHTATHGIQLALAGKVTEQDLPVLRVIGPEIIAVRGAVCDHGDRIAAISEARVREFKTALRQ
jgi:uncharacterized protein (UPF0264 family)